MIYALPKKNNHSNPSISFYSNPSISWQPQHQVFAAWAAARRVGLALAPWA